MLAERVEIGLSWLQGQRFAMQRLLERLVRQSSFTLDPPGVNAVVAMLDQELRRIGLKTERLRSPKYGDHLYFESSGQGPFTFLIGHTDTVHARRAFDGFELAGDLAKGPGVFDMKGGLVVTLFALEALARAALLRHVPVRGLIVSDEEVGSPDSQAHLRQRAQGAAYALGFEPGRAGDAIVTRRKGVASLSAIARGVAAHAGAEHQRGKNAVWALARFVDRAQALTDYGRGSTVNVGLFQGGTTRNTVPELARAEVDLRYVTTEDGQQLYAALEEAAAAAAVEGTRLELVKSAWRPPMVRTDASAELAREFGRCQEESGLASGEAPLSGGGSDASTTSDMGIPSIDGLGPRGSGFHTVEERVDLASLVPKALAVARFLGGRGG
ncbi:M20/M25/M40 family metallo-hydrolase [Anaeromyxobacter diazotrophicus]|uniref:Peptidase M20 n=1 Tax=Anaeromyxobacter diazotrophicus TaxID=2590199 RepID=A0A7I9VQR0_9BACT|nr:M20/M25/M40 family metallo-hydrolase [Anaeromyxobacter diazotrophicus]GEJ58598.1 peptidase M20 [Anaeromyxobacter diazotrophicus]